MEEETCILGDLDNNWPYYVTDAVEDTADMERNSPW